MTREQPEIPVGGGPAGPARRLCAGALCVVAWSALAAPAVAALRISPPPDFVAPGGQVEFRVESDVAGTVEVVRRVGPAAARIAQVATVPGRAVTVRDRPTRAGAALYEFRTGQEPLVSRRVSVRAVRMVAVGDVSPGSAIAAVHSHGPAWHWAQVGAWLRSQDLVVANLETAVGTSGSPWPKLFTFRAPPSSIRAAAVHGGVDVVTLANNHALDFGRPTFMSGLRSIDRAGLVRFGGGLNLGEAVRPVVVERGGLRIAFAGFNTIEPPEFFAGPGRSGTAPATPELVRASVRAARKQADLVIVYFHWGIEYDRAPNAEQRMLAEQAFDAGADVVLGAHPHVLQPVERRGRRLVAWSLGNFVFSPGRPPGADSGALRIDLDARGVVRAGMRPVQLVETRPVFTR